jgi:hypothetical protein
MFGGARATGRDQDMSNIEHNMLEGSTGRYVGRLVWTPLEDGRLMELIENFGFIDPREEEWHVPKGIHVDGASIPRPLWSLVGSPFTGKYRDASVIHDYYCDVRVRPWRSVHAVFYDAMIASGVNAARAKLMYAAVYYGGPRWPDSTVHNNKVTARIAGQHAHYSILHSDFTEAVMSIVEVDGTSVEAFLQSHELTPPGGPEARLHLNDLEKLISEYDPSPAEIATALDASTAAMDIMFPKQRVLADVIATFE